jgi:hypothetical protein
MKSRLNRVHYRFDIDSMYLDSENENEPRWNNMHLNKMHLNNGKKTRINRYDWIQ